MECSGRNSLIKFYFGLGLQQEEIRHFLLLQHNIQLSKRYLKRVLKNLKLWRRKKYSSIDEVLCFIDEQLQYSSQLHGYRWMHLKCLQHGLVVSRETVRMIMKELDPDGVELRKRRRLKRRQYYNKGPNYLWHIDGYDKLKPYGIAISGCIDGFSRYIIWLKACYTNNNPRVISGYFLTSLEELGNCPRTVRTDLGTENRHIEHIQTFLGNQNFQNRNMLPPFLYGTSQHNQRIESWWCILRKEHAQFWMNLFETLKDDNHFNGTFIDKSLIQYCFLNLIQEELDQVVLEWNTHRITSSRNSRSPTGKPIIMYQLPALYNTKNYSVEIRNEEVRLFKGQSLIINDDMVCCDKHVHELCTILMNENGYNAPNNVYQALDLYMDLRRNLYELL